MSKDTYARLQNAKYPQIRISKRTYAIVREIAKRWQVSNKRVIDEAIDRLAAHIDYMNSL